MQPFKMDPTLVSGSAVSQESAGSSNVSDKNASRVVLPPEIRDHIIALAVDEALQSSRHAALSKLDLTISHDIWRDKRASRVLLYRLRHRLKKFLFYGHG